MSLRRRILRIANGGKTNAANVDEVFVVPLPHMHCFSCANVVAINITTRTVIVAKCAATISATFTNAHVFGVSFLSSLEKASHFTSVAP